MTLPCICAIIQPVLMGIADLGSGDKEAATALGTDAHRPRDAAGMDRCSLGPSVKTSKARYREEMRMAKIRIGGIMQNAHLSLLNVTAVPDRPGIAAAILGELGRRGINVQFIVQCIDHN